MLNRLLHLWRLREPYEYIRYHIENDEQIDYLNLASRCKSVNMFNRLHIELANICAPLEIVEIGNIKKSKRPRATNEWLNNFSWWAPDLMINPQRFRRRAILWAVMLYHDPEWNGCDKNLLVAFADDARRLMLPISVFLQYIDSRMWDVLVLKRGERSHLHGLDEMSSDFFGVVERVKSAVSPAQYRRVITIGTSGGGFPAIWAAILLRASRGISICGAAARSLHPSLESQQVPDGLDLCYVYGGAQDQQHARALQSLFGGRLRPVPEIDDHVLLYHMIVRRQFGAFISEMLS
jgi:hypothetical protein